MNKSEMKSKLEEIVENEWKVFLEGKVVGYVSAATARKAMAIALDLWAGETEDDDFEHVSACLDRFAIEAAIPMLSAEDPRP